MSQVNLILIRGVSLSYDSSSINKQRTLWYIKKDANNYIQLYLDNVSKTFNFQKCVAGVVTILTSNAQTFSKWQTFNILCSQTSTGMSMRMLKNTGTMEVYTNTSVTYFEGSSSLYPLTKDSVGSELDGFLDSAIFIKDTVYDDTTAEAILRGTQTGFTFPELFDINAVTLHANATRANGVITLNATGTYQANKLSVPVLPNNQYQITVGTNTGWVAIDEQYNNIVTKQDTISRYHNTTGTTTFITGPKTNKVVIYLDNESSGAGTYTFSNISLKIKM